MRILSFSDILSLNRPSLIIELRWIGFIPFYAVNNKHNGWELLHVLSWNPGGEGEWAAEGDAF